MSSIRAIAVVAITGAAAPVMAWSRAANPEVSGGSERPVAAAIIRL
jgi:hypothetical protein